MKTFRKIGMALMAVLMSVNFAACSNEDDNPTEEGSSTNQPIVEKKLVRITRNDYAGNPLTIDFKYDENGNVIKVEYCDKWYASQSGQWNIDEETIEYIWGSNNSLTWSFESVLNEAKKLTEIEGLYCAYDNDGHIKEYGDIEDGTIHRIYTWNNNQLEKITANDNVTTFSYEGQTCKGFFPLLIDYAEIGFSSYSWERVLHGDYIFMAQPELIGIKTTSLPSENDCSNYTMLFDNYDFDSDGYLIRCTVSKQWDTGTNYGNDIYRFIWE